jgi:AcrR family transcriptional regulator
MTATSADRRAQRQQRVRASIEAAALRLFAERGFEETTVEEIAAAAGIAPRTFFNYFAAKEDVILAPLRDESDELRRAIVGRPRSEHVLESIKTAAGQLPAAYGDETTVLIRMRAMRTSPALLGREAQMEQRWIGAIASALAERDGQREPGNRHRLIAHVAVGLLAAALEIWLKDDGRSDLLALIDEAFGQLRQIAAGS